MWASLWASRLKWPMPQQSSSEKWPQYTHSTDPRRLFCDLAQNPFHRKSSTDRHRFSSESFQQNPFKRKRLYRHPSKRLLLLRPSNIQIRRAKVQRASFPDSWTSHPHLVFRSSPIFSSPRVHTNFLSVGSGGGGDCPEKGGCVAQDLSHSHSPAHDVPKPPKKRPL